MPEGKYNIQTKELDESSIPLPLLLKYAEWKFFFKTRGFEEVYPNLILHNPIAEQTQNQILDELSSILAQKERMRPRVEVRTRTFVSEQDEPFILVWLLFHNFGTIDSDIRTAFAYLVTSGALEWIRREYTVEGRVPYLLVVDADNRKKKGMYWQNIMADYQPVDLLEDVMGDEVLITAVGTQYRTSKQMRTLTKRENYREKYTRLRQEFVSLYCAYRDMTTIGETMLETKVLQTFGSVLYRIFESSLRYSELKLKVQLIQKALNRQQKPDFEWIEHEVYRQLMYMYDDLKKKEVELEKVKDVSMPEPGLIREVRELYPQVVMSLHPDLHPYQDEYEQDLFRRSQEAYDLLNVIELRNLCNNVRLMGLGEPDFDILPDDDIDAMIHHVEQMIEQYDQMIDTKEREYPFTYKETFSTPKNVAENLANLENQAEDILAQVKAYQQQYDELLRQCHVE